LVIGAATEIYGKVWIGPNAVQFDRDGFSQPIRHRTGSLGFEPGSDPDTALTGNVSLYKMKMRYSHYSVSAYLH
jgi:hypothetical protein